MRIAAQVDYAGDVRQAADTVARWEDAGVDVAFVPEAYGQDAISLLGYLAARTEHMLLGPGILPIFSRTPALIAQTAVGLDVVSGPCGARARCIGSAGRGGVARGRLRSPVGSHARGRRDLPYDLAPRASRSPRHLRTSRDRARHDGARQAAQAHHPPAARADPDLPGRHRGAQRRARGGDRRRLASHPVLTGACGCGVGRVSRSRACGARCLARAARHRRRDRLDRSGSRGAP